jgi:N-acyl-D-aspartate/D-glutamate deacylase
MGERGATRETADAADLERMRTLAREAMEAGAIGFSSSRLSIHRSADGGPIPSFEAPLEELKAIAGGLSDAGKGTLQMVLDAPYHAWTEEVGKLLEVTKASGRPTTFTLAASNIGQAFWREALELVEDANAAGEKVTAQVLPRPIGLLSGLELTINPFVLCPSYEAISKLRLSDKVAALRKPELRARLLSEPLDQGHPLAMMGRQWKWMFPLGNPPNYAPSREQSIFERAKVAGVTPEQWAYDYLIEGDGKNMILGALGNFPDGKLDGLEALLRHPDCILGLGDGGAHYGAICDASYPTFLLTHWVRQEKRLSIAEAIRILATKPAQALGFGDRGVLRVGAKADINVIDLPGMHLPPPHIVHDLPAGGRRLDQGATGYEATIVSGEVISRFDKPTGALPGRLVRGPQALAA